MKEPVARSDLRLALGGAYYGTLRRLLWLKERSSFARERCEAILPYSAASHKTPLMRRLRDVDMWMQENKVTNLRLASVRVNGIVLHPGQTFSYWYLIGRPTARKGYLPGMLLRNGRAVAGVGGGLCQLSNLIFWMTLHVTVGEHDLIGEWRCSAAPECRYEIVEREHEMRAEYWGGYTRHNVLWQQRFDADGVLLDEKPIVRNDAIMMYSPYLEEGGTSE